MPIYGNGASTQPRRQDNQPNQRDVKINWADGYHGDDEQRNDQHDDRTGTQQDDGPGGKADDYLGFDDQYNEYDCLSCDATFSSNSQLHEHAAECHDGEDEPEAWHVDAFLPVVRSRINPTPSQIGLGSRESPLTIDDEHENGLLTREFKQASETTSTTPNVARDTFTSTIGFPWPFAVMWERRAAFK
ncbi:hypothetical protein FQN50_002986 [Emmonsiellopsis sp. PD_5]|nr:hypothetical protein FQN50_002986 [Emmonsiellopsis sp. PD_5]